MSEKIHKRCGITTRFNERISEWKRKLKNVRNIKKFEFKSRVEAQNWEDGHPDPWEHHGGGNNPDDPNAKWYGYEFDHDGPLN